MKQFMIPVGGISKTRWMNFLICFHPEFFELKNYLSVG